MSEDDGWKTALGDLLGKRIVDVVYPDPPVVAGITMQIEIHFEDKTIFYIGKGHLSRIIEAMGVE